MRFDPGWKQVYERDGVVHLPGAFADWADRLVGALDRVIAKSREPGYLLDRDFPLAPQNPLSVLVGASAHGRWTLRVSNFGFNTSPSGSLVPPPQINNWQLTLPRAVPSAGVGERVSDRFTAGFRVYTLDPTNPLSRESWTAVGAASANEGANAGSVTAVAVDPSDPSGNTVYVTGGTGGVWKTTNFMTQDVDGPTYQPLTDFGPTTAIHVQSLALFPRNNDPAQTIIFALTGEGNTLGTADGASSGGEIGSRWS